MKINSCLGLIFLLLISVQQGFSIQDSTSSLAFKKNRPLATYPLFYTPDLSYKLQQQFQLIKMANSGDPLAQHELGLRLLQGTDGSADTVKAAKWISQAAASELPSACYNYGILLLNGWGVKWDPFEAFLNFKKAAESGMPQAQYITGMFYTENLVVKKNLNEAYKWIKMSEEKEYGPASDALKEFKEKNLLKDSSFTKIPGNQTINSPLVFIDFEQESDTTIFITEQDLSKALFLSGYDELIESGKRYINSDSVIDLKELDVDLLMEAVNSGCPEALTVAGYFYETGNYFESDPLQAGILYYLGSKLDSRHSAYQLWKLSRSPEFMKLLLSKAKNEEPDALFLLYGLINYDFIDTFSDEQANDFLVNAASTGMEYAVLEMSLSIISGRQKGPSKEEAISKLKTMMMNNPMAEQRYLSICLIDSSYINQEQIEKLFYYQSKGSIISETLLGYCYTNGLGMRQDMGAAVKYYRRAAQRGSGFALKGLENLYNKIRPSNELFNIQ